MPPPDSARKVVLPGGAGLVGQNLVVRLKDKGYSKIVVLDKHRANIEVLKRVQPDITVEYADLAEPGDWQRPPRQNRCRPHRTLNLGAMMEEQVGQIRTSIQGPCCGAVAAA